MRDLKKGRSKKNITQAVHDSTDQTWDRPPLPSSFEDISFQQLDAEEYHDRGNTYARFFGITQEGHSVLCNVTGFIHYFYCPVPKGFEENLTEFTNYLKATFDGIERVEITSKESIWGYSNNIKTPFFKIFAKNNISKIRSAFQNGQVHNIDPCITYDNINYLLRLMIDCKITGMSWISYHLILNVLEEKVFSQKPNTIRLFKSLMWCRNPVNQNRL